MWFYAVSVFLIFWYLRKILSPNAKLREYGDRMPGPKSYPIIGNIDIFLFSAKSTLQIAKELRDKYGPVNRVWMTKKLITFLSDPDDLEIFLSSNKFTDKSNTYRLLDTWLGKTNLLTSNGETWRQHRKLLTPSFHFKILEKSVPMVLRNARILCDKIAVEANRTSFDIEPYVEKSALDIIFENAMGLRMEIQSTDNSTYLDSVKKVSEAIIKRFRTPWLFPEFIFRLSDTGKIYYDNLKTIKDVGRKVIAERRKFLEKNPVDCETTDNNDTGRKQPKPFLDFLLTQASFSDVEIENEVQAFLFAGHDTTKAAISFCLYNLAHHQHCQEKVVQEVQDILINIDRDLTYRDFFDLKYLENVIKESLRLYPPVPFISRKINEDVQVSNGYILPKGSIVNICIFLTHRNEKYFAEAEKFIPERFESTNDNRNPFAYVPFSAGPRNCIGQKFAMLAMKVIIAFLLIKYQFLPDERAEPLDLESQLILRSKNKLPVKIKKRN